MRTTNYYITFITLILVFNFFILKAQDTLSFKSLKQMSECKIILDTNCLQRTNPNIRVFQLIKMLLDSGKINVMATVDERGILIFKLDVFRSLNTIYKVSREDSLLLFNYLYEIEECMTLIDWYQLHFDKNDNITKKK